MTVRYDPAVRCSSGPTPGALKMRDHWRRTTGLGDLGIFNCRPVRGGGSLSLHAEGRATDLKANANDPVEKAKADAYVEWLIANSDELQVQYLIWDGRSWKSGRGWRPYSGVSAHRDHIHAELNRDGATRPSPLWDGAAVPSPPAPTPGGFLMALSDKEQNELLEKVRASHDALRGQAVGPDGLGDRIVLHDVMILRQQVHGLVAGQQQSLMLLATLLNVVDDDGSINTGVPIGRRVAEIQKELEDLRSAVAEA